LQDGFDMVEEMCNGYKELWKRDDKYQILIYLYKQMDFNRDWNSFSDLENGIYMDNINRPELIITQYEILKDLTISEKKELFQLALDNQKKKYALQQYWGTVGMETTCAILSRIMYLDHYQPLIEEYNSNELMLIHVSYIKLLRHMDIVNKVMILSEDYLKILKSN